MRAAEAGQGVALPYTALIQPELETGRLVRLLDQETPPVIIYSLAYQECAANDAKIIAFRDWIFDEVRGVPSPQLRIVATGGLG